MAFLTSARRAIPVAALFTSVLLIYTLTNYGGVRSPDSEVVFRVGESIAEEFEFYVEKPLESFKNHGVAPGKDGRLYGLYGPAQSFLLAPWIVLARTLNMSGWYTEDRVSLPISHYNGLGFVEFVNGTPPAILEPHAVRFVASMVNPLVGALAVLVFFLLLKIMVPRVTSALIVAGLYGLGTPAWHYSGTFFSESLTTLFLLLSVYPLAQRDPRLSDRGRGLTPAALVVSGACLGLACTTHVSALFFVPFIGFWAGYLCLVGKESRLLAMRLLTWFVAGLAVLLILWGGYNFARFGSVLETGRTVTADYSDLYGVNSFRWSWGGFSGLLFGAGKGLFLFCPAVLLGLIAWPRLHRRHRILSVVLGATALSRLILVAGLDIWHGGFSLGPRHLLLLVPFLLIPIVFWVDEQLHRGRMVRLATFWLLCTGFIVQQFYFALGEVFSYYHVIKWRASRAGENIFVDNRIYLDWGLTPLTHLHTGKRAPFLLQDVGLGNLALWGIGSTILAVCLTACFGLIRRQRQASTSEPGL